MHQKRMKLKKFQCAKCSHTEYELGEIRAAGGFWSKFFNVESERYKSISCKKCSYTEFYKGTQSTAGNILDFFGN